MSSWAAACKGLPLLGAVVLGGCTAAPPPPQQWPGDGCQATVADSTVRSRRWDVQTETAVVAVSALLPRKACFPAVVLTPGGLQPGQSLLSSPLADALSSSGIGVFAWDPPGRGESEGQEDANGPAGQDALAALLRWVAAHDEVDPSMVVLYTRSFGAALGAGALARHPDLQPSHWLDYEGPGWLEEDLDFADPNNRETLAAYADESTDPQQWWRDRSPAAQMADTTTPYRRLQGLPDHALGPRVAHAQAMLSAGTDAHLNTTAVPEKITEQWVQSNVVDGGLSYDGDDAIALVRQSMDW